MSWFIIRLPEWSNSHCELCWPVPLFLQHWHRSHTGLSTSMSSLFCYFGKKTRPPSQRHLPTKLFGELKHNQLEKGRHNHIKSRSLIFNQPNSSLFIQMAYTSPLEHLTSLTSWSETELLISTPHKCSAPPPAFPISVSDGLLTYLLSPILYHQVLLALHSKN